MRYLMLFGFISCVLSSEEISPRIIIVGSGVSGIAAASRLIQNGFNNITIFEAENRMGGRVYSVEIGEYLADFGGEWVTGEVGNVVFELAWPLGLLQRSDDNKEWTQTIRMFGSSGNEIPQHVVTPLMEFFDDLTSSNHGGIDDLKTGSFGEYAEIKINEYFKNHSEITADLHQPLLHLLELLKMADDAAISWNEVSAVKVLNYPECEGDQVINWKERTYSTILDILMKKYPNPEEELPIRNLTKLNTKVIEIKFDETPIKVTTADGEEHFADHVIVTPSLGVLKKNYNKLFNPLLPENKLNAIKNLSFGGTAKIIIYYENPWWLNDPIFGRSIYWTEKDRKELENDPQKKWMLGVSLCTRIEHKPKLLLFWVSGPYVREMELTPEGLFQEQVKQLMNKFFGKTYNLTEPTIIKRTLWNTNENFLGTYSFPGIQDSIAGARTEDYAEPLMQNDKPILLFAGEGTSIHYGMVNGAIETGWREADRLVNYYNIRN
ncbi:spermine oxidase [Microplitis demolitor]|uniref:spermine oxidase n=1 Tax=Microplitis demolitor TaxID=69319 RepID=UPI0004CDA218|nr:spermine oxidase [Microplitis demolitor]